ncbi:MAG: PQQ-binding-like beta-propeller repeat protein [Planctomycetota bacterium]
MKPTRKLVVSLIAGAASALLTPSALAQDVVWPGFRGPTGDGVVSGAGHPTSWSMTEDGQENIAWAVEVPGASWSSPVVVDDTVYVVSAIAPWFDRPAPFRGAGGGNSGEPAADADFAMMAFSLDTGEQLWSKTLATMVPKEPTHPSNTFATESPTTDGERVYAHFGAIGLVVAVDLEGNEVWRKDVGAYSHTAGFGTGSSVVVHDGVLIAHSDNTKESFIVGFDAATGDEKWRQERDRGSSWASPLLVERDGGDQVVVPGPNAVTAYNPANGEMLWKATGFGGSFSASAVSDGDFVYFGNSGPGRRGPLISISLDAEGEFDADPDDDRVRWFASSQGLTFSSPVIVDGVLYGARGSFFAAHSCEDGERVFRTRLPDSSEIVASAWSVGDTVYVMNENGITFAIEAGEEFKLVSTNTIEGDLFSGTPSVAKGALLIRGADKLYCIRSPGS